MKQRFVKAVCAVLCLALLCSLCGCGILKNIRENARLQSEREILASPAEDALVSEFNAALARAKTEMGLVTESVKYSAGRPHAAGEGKGVDILDAAADTLKKMIMEMNPGSSGEKGAVGSGLLLPLPAEIPAAAAARNTSTVTVTDENGEDVTGEDGAVEKTEVFADNTLTTTFRFYTEEVKTETAEDGSVKEEKVLVPAEDALIEQVFGAPAEKKAVLAAFDVVSGYLKVKDYDIAYKDCTVTAEENLESGALQSVTYEKKMAVTAAVTGVGSLAEMGDITVTLDVTKTVTYHLYISEEDAD